MKSPTRVLNPAFRDCIVRMQRNKAIRSFLLSQHAGFPWQSQWSELLHAKRVRATPLIIHRLERVADRLGFPRHEIFALEQEPQAERQQEVSA